jgi:hypothetical protein
MRSEVMGGVCHDCGGSLFTTFSGIMGVEEHTHHNRILTSWWEALQACLHQQDSEERS